MKRKIIFVLLVKVSIISLGQKPIATGTPCTDAMSMDAKGRWIKSEELIDRIKILEQKFPIEKLQTMIDK